MIDGIFLGKTNDFYNSIEAYRSTSIKKALQGPEYFFMEDKQTPAMHFGTAVHTRILEPEHFNYEIKLDGRTKAGKAQKEKHVPVLTEEEFHKLEFMKEAFFINKDCWEIHQESDKEAIAVSFFQGIPVKAKADLYGSNYIADIKTTSSLPLTLKDVERTIENYNYHLSAAFYLDCFNEHFTDSSKLDEFIWIFLESKPPFKVVIARTKIDSWLMQKGHKLAREALDKACLYKQNSIYREELSFTLD